jgi:serine O-acetyltransferase
VTLDAKLIDIGYNPESRPFLGDNMTIGARAKVLGEVEIEDNVTLVANVVVTKSLENNVVAAGIPARVIQYLDTIISRLIK